MARETPASRSTSSTVASGRVFSEKTAAAARSSRRRVSGALYSVDTTTGAATAIGAGFGVLSLHGLAYDPTRDALVGVEDTVGIDSRLWEISRTTGLPTSMGSLGVPVLGAGLAYDPTQDVFWITDNEAGVSDNFYVAPGGGGSATRIGGLSQQTGNGGLAFVPEPGTGLLLALGLAAVGAQRRRRAGAGHARVARLTHGLSRR